MPSLRLKPLGNRILVKQIEIKEIGGIIIASNSREAKELIATEGEVIAVGAECEHIKKGNQVFYGKYAGFIVDREAVRRLISDNSNRGEYKIMSEMDVVGLVTPESKEGI
jgi:chaperonin GroES